MPLVNYTWYPSDTDQKVRILEQTPAGSGGKVLNDNFSSLADSVVLFDTHASNKSNPHTVTATQVGRGTAQWNADKIQGKTVSSTPPANNQILRYNSTTSTWVPTTFDGVFELVDDTTPQLGGDLDLYDGSTTHIIKNSDAGVAIAPKNGSYFQLSSAGDTRGYNAIDLQIGVTSAMGSYIAAGNYAAILGGLANKAEGNVAAIIGGYYSQADANYSTIRGASALAYNSGQHVDGCDNIYGVAYTTGGSTASKNNGFAQSSVTNRLVAIDEDVDFTLTNTIDSGSYYYIPPNTVSRIIIQCLSSHRTTSTTIPAHIGYWSITGVAYTNTDGDIFWMNGDTLPSTTGAVAANIMSSGSPPSLVVQTQSDKIYVGLSGGGAVDHRAVIHFEALDTWYKTL